MSYLPICLEVADRRCLVAGGGQVGARRIATLVTHGARVVVAAPEGTPDLEALARDGRIEWNRERYATRFIEGAFLAVAATSDEAVNDLVAADAALRGIPICRADRAEQGDFVFPSVVERGNLVISVTTSGASPTLAAVLREELALSYGEEWTAISALFGALRREIKSRFGTETERRNAVRRVLADDRTRMLLNEGKIIEAEARAKECL